MLNDDRNEMTREDIDEDMKNVVADIFCKSIPGAFRDKDGFVWIPKPHRNKNDSDTDKL